MLWPCLVHTQLEEVMKTFRVIMVFGWIQRHSQWYGTSDTTKNSSAVPGFQEIKMILLLKIGHGAVGTATAHASSSIQIFALPSISKLLSLAVLIQRNAQIVIAMARCFVILNALRIQLALHVRSSPMQLSSLLDDVLGAGLAMITHLSLVPLQVHGARRLQMDCVILYL